MFVIASGEFTWGELSENWPTELAQVCVAGGSCPAVVLTKLLMVVLMLVVIVILGWQTTVAVVAVVAVGSIVSVSLVIGTVLSTLYMLSF